MLDGYAQSTIKVLSTFFPPLCVFFSFMGGESGGVVKIQEGDEVLGPHGRIIINHTQWQIIPHAQNNLWQIIIFIICLSTAAITHSKYAFLQYRSP